MRGKRENLKISDEEYLEWKVNFKISNRDDHSKYMI